MGVDAYLSLFTIVVILLSSFCGVYLALRSFETDSHGRFGRALFIWLVWVVTVSAVYVCSQLLSGPLRSSEWSRLYLEFAYLFLVGIAGMFAIFGATKFLRWRTGNDENNTLGGFPTLATVKPSILQRAFFVNLAAIVGFTISFTIVTVFDDLYYGRFNPTKESEHGFTIYD